MKIIIKILCIPIMVLMWIAIKIGSLMTYISGLALGIISGIIAVISIIYMLTGAGMNGFTQEFTKALIRAINRTVKSG